MKFSLEQQLWEMLSREILVSALALTKRPILETIPGPGIGFKLRPPRSSISQSCCGRRHQPLHIIRQNQKSVLILFFVSLQLRLNCDIIFSCSL